MPNKGKTQDGHTTPVTRVLSYNEARRYSMEHHTQPNIKYVSPEFTAECVCGHVSTSTNFDAALERTQRHVREQWDEQKHHLYTHHYEETFKCYHVSCTCGWYEHDLNDIEECSTEYRSHLEREERARKTKRD